MDQPDQVKLKLSSKIGKRSPVFMAEFSNGRMVSDSKVKFECFKLDGRESMIQTGHAKRKLMASNGHLTYIGESNDTSALRYLVGVWNKSTGKMKLYDSTHFRLKPVMAANNIVNNSTSTEKNYWEDRKNLTEEFGGKAQQRILKARLKLDVKTDSLDELLNDDSLGASPSHPDPFANSPSVVSYLPPTNKDAQTLDQVFNINDIISPDIDASLQDHANSWLETYKVDSVSAKLNFCKFVLHHIDRNLDDSDKLKYLLYYNYLVTFKHLTYADLRKKDPTPLIPEPFKGNMLKTFTNVSKSEGGRSSRTFPPTQKDKLVAHLIVLAMLINDYCVCMSQILSDLNRVSPRQCTIIAQALGCRIASQKVGELSEKFIELKLPLNVVLPRFTKRQF